MSLLSLHQVLCGGGALLFLPSPPAAAAFCFCSHSKTPARIISKYLKCAYWPWEICPVFFWSFFSFFNKIQDGRQSPMSLSRAWTALWICFMFGLKERPYPAHVLIGVWSDSDNKNFFLTLQNFCRYFSFVHFGYHQNLVS